MKPPLSDKELLDFLEQWGGTIRIYDDISTIEVRRTGKVDRKTGLYKDFTMEVPDRGLVWAHPKTKKPIGASLRITLTRAINYRNEVNAPVLKETVLKDLQEYANERRARDEEIRKENLKEDPKWKEKPDAYSDEKEVLKVKRLVEQNELKQAAKVAHDTDTFVREGFPDSFSRYLYQHKVIR